MVEAPCEGQLFDNPGAKAPLDDLMVTLLLLRLSGDDLQQDKRMMFGTQRSSDIKDHYSIDATERKSGHKNLDICYCCT